MPNFLERIEALKELILQYKLIIAGVLIVAIVIAFAWSMVFVILRGVMFALIALFVIFAVILIWVKLRFKQPTLKKLFGEKKRILKVIKIAEQRYMRRKLSEKDFNKLFKDKQKKLIEVEAMIAKQYDKEKPADKSILDVQAKKRHILKGLLDEKKSVIKELDIAEKRYLKRKLDAKTYKDLVQKNQHRLIELEATIKELYNDANISKVMELLKQNLSLLEDQKRTGKKKKSKDDRQEKIDIAQEIADQISKK